MIKQEIGNILTQRKTNAEKLAKENLEYAFSLKGFKKKYSEYKTKQIEYAKEKIYSNKTSKIDLHKIESELATFLKNHKDNKKRITLDDLSPKYTCKKCNDNGFDLFGNECECVKAIKTQLLAKNQTTLKTFENCNFDIFDNDIIPSLFKRFEEWSKIYPKEKNNLVVVGPTGTGKTFFCQCLASEFINQGKFVVYKTAFAMNQDFLKYHTAFNEDKYKFIEPYISSDVLIIDDLGSEQNFKNVTIEYLYLILNERSINKKITIINSNLQPNDITKTYTERCASRILNKETNFLIQFLGEDLRLKRINNQKK